MVNIDTPSIAYCNMRNMYVGADAVGLQLDTDLELKNKEILELCNSISSAIYKLNVILKPDTYKVATGNI